ncbi:MAG: phosphate ABC transporter substrate-binding protein [Myxococcaceae bacterium]|nr:phosphate ABC transporter substrate-binding protein [Myxococcaceae bacterium]
MSRHAPARLCLLALLTWAISASAGTITIKGSDTMVALCQRWARAFRDANPSVRLQVTGGGSGTGLAALVEGSTDIAMSSRPIAPIELERIKQRTGVDPVVIEVARDGVTFFVNPGNPVRALSVSQLAGLFSGDVTRWSQVGGDDRRVILYTRETTSGTSEFVRDHLLGGLDFAPIAQPLPGTGAVVNAVSRERFGVGFGGAAFSRGVVPLRVRVDADEIAPTPEAVKTGRYPFSRALTFVLARPAEGDVHRFLQWVASDEGQALVVRAGFFPLR